MYTRIVDCKLQPERRQDFNTTLRDSGVPGKFCTSGCEANWYGRSLVCHEERSMQRNRS